MKKTILSVQQQTFTDKVTGLAKDMWRVYLADSTGAVGSLYSTKDYKVGDTVTLGIVANRDGKLVAKIVD